MAPLGKFEAEALASLQRAVTRALDRKRRLGQYAVFWENGRVIFDGPRRPGRAIPGREGPAGRKSTRSRIVIGASGGPIGLLCEMQTA